MLNPLLNAMLICVILIKRGYNMVIDIENVQDMKAILEYVLAHMEDLDCADECRAKVQNAIDLCTMHSIDQIQEEFGLI